MFKMSYKVKKLNKKESVFFSCYFLYLLISILYTSMFSVYILSIYKYLLWGTVSVLIINEIARGKYSIKALIIAVLIAALALFVSWSVDGSVFILCLLAFIWTSRNIDFDKIAGYTIAFSSIIMLFVIFSSLVGIIENYHMIVDDRLRYFLGFRYELYLPTYMFNLSALYVYIHRKKIGAISLFIILILNTVVYLVTNSRLSYIMVLLLLLTTFLLKVFPVFVANRKFPFRVMVVSYVIWFIISIYLTISYNRSVSWMNELDLFLSHRIVLGQRGLLLYGVHLFGQTIEWVGMGLDSSTHIINGTYNYVDCLYIKMLIQYGIIFSIFYIALHTFTAYQCYKRKQYFLLIILSFLSASVFIEDLSLLLHYNTFWFAVGMVLRNSVRERGKYLKERPIPDYIDINRLNSSQKRKLK